MPEIVKPYLFRLLQHHWSLFSRNRPGPVILSEECREPLARLLNCMEPKKAEGWKKVRYGSRYDGGYIMLQDFEGISGAFSFGIGGNVRWDLAMAEKGIPVQQYDHTVTGPPAHHDLFHFHKERIGVVEEENPPTRILSTLIAAQPPGEMILKIDIEGDEWAVFAQTDPDELKIFRQILVEFHHFPKVADPAWREQAMTALAHLGRHHGVVHVHGNNFAEAIHAGDICIPNGFEVTYVRKDAYHLVPTTETFPGACDRPNNPYWPETQLGTFNFKVARPEPKRPLSQ